MREKPVSEKTINNYIDFLYSVKENALPYQCQVSLSEIVTNYAINKTAAKAIQEIGFIKKISTTSWEWLGDKEVLPNKEMALRVLDYLLHKNKKTVHTPIPELSQDIAETLKQIRDNIASTNEVIQRNSLARSKRSKDLPGEQVHGETLFTEADKRFELIKAIAPGFYSSIGDAQNFTEKMEKASKRIIQAADYLLNLSKIEVKPEEPANN